MSTDRLDELGIPRRAFLKAAAGAALIAPAIVSFGMDVIAEGPNASALAAQSQPNQCFPNQSFPNQSFSNQALFPGHPLWDILDTILFAVYESHHGLIKPVVPLETADKLTSLAIKAEILAVSGNSSGASNTWSQFIKKVEEWRAKLPHEVADELIREAQRARQELA